MGYKVRANLILAAAPRAAKWRSPEAGKPPGLKPLREEGGNRGGPQTEICVPLRYTLILGGKSKREGSVCTAASTGPASGSKRTVNKEEQMS